MRRAPLALVLALATPLHACPGDDEGETAATTAGSSSGGATTAPTSTGEPPTSTGSSGPASTGGTLGPADGSTTDGGPSPIDACTAACERLVECDVEDVPNCGIPCANIQMMIGGCEAEYLAQQECVAVLSCGDVQAWADAMMVGTEHPCAAEDGAFQACIGGESG
jgi:hypothetical protein